MRNSFQPNDRIRKMTEDYARDAVRIAHEKLSIELDWTDESVEHVETILSMLHSDLGQSKPAEEEIIQFAKIFGSYVGEVYRKNHGAVWGMVTVQGNRFTGLQITDSRTAFWPWVHAQKRITKGPEFNIWDTYQSLLSGNAAIISDDLLLARAPEKKPLWSFFTRAWRNNLPGPDSKEFQH